MHPKQPIHCPDLQACGGQELEEVVAEARCANCLPDVIVTGDYGLLFTSQLGERFVREGAFDVETPAYTSWQVVQDLTVKGVRQDISSWEELLEEEGAAWRFTVHGHLDRVTYSLMNFLHVRLKEEGIVRFARRIVDIKHFSYIIKRFGSEDTQRTAFAVLPSAAVARIPSNKRVQVLQLREGMPVSPLVMLHKVEKREALSELLGYLRGTAFGKLLQAGGCLLPEDISQERHVSPNLGIEANAYITSERRFSELYFSNLPTGEIAARVVPGSICK
jgi:hypothetical protein